MTSPPAADRNGKDNLQLEKRKGLKADSIFIKAVPMNI
jgi:hypothetical protein